MPDGLGAEENCDRDVLVSVTKLGHAGLRDRAPVDLPAKGFCHEWRCQGGLHSHAKALGKLR